MPASGQADPAARDRPNAARDMLAEARVRKFGPKRSVAVKHSEMAKGVEYAFPLFKRTWHDAPAVSAVPDPEGLESSEVLAVGDPAVVLNRPSVVVLHP